MLNTGVDGSSLGFVLQLVAFHQKEEYISSIPENPQTSHYLKVKSLIQDRLRVEQLLLHIKGSQLGWFRHRVRMHPGHITGVMWACKCLSVPPEQEVAGRRDVWASQVRLLHPTYTRISRREWVDGTDGLQRRTSKYTMDTMMLTVFVALQSPPMVELLVKHSPSNRHRRLLMLS